ncbi:MAG: FtsX-like permease family protein [Thermoguttaceae bacterium]
MNSFYWQQILRSLWYYRWIYAAVLLGVFCEAAVFTGSLLVGDSMRGSLLDLTEERLGKIDTILLGNRFFHPPAFHSPNVYLTNNVSGKIDSDSNSNSNSNSDSGADADSIPVILYSAAAFSSSESAESGATDLELLGLDERACHLGSLPPFPGPNEIIINEALAARLNVHVGETISLRFLSPQSIPPDSSFGHRDNVLLRSRLTITSIIPNKGIGRFSLKIDQSPQPLGIVSLSWLQRKLEVENKVNAVFQLNDSVEFFPTLDDLGILIDEDANYYYIKSDRMIFTPQQVAEIVKSSDMFQSTYSYLSPNAALVYLATSIQATKNGRSVPYSTVCAIDLSKDFHKSGLNALIIEKTPIALNTWTADQLDVVPGDVIELTWLAPENTQVQHSRQFILSEIVPMDKWGNSLVPDVKGLTDENSIANWNPPFPFDAKKIRQEDEDYWDKYRAAPKAFVPLNDGHRFWSSRFGDYTTLIVAKNKNIDIIDTINAKKETETKIEKKSSIIDSSQLRPELFGIQKIPVKAAGYAASSGTTPFSVLFISFSFFIIFSALILVWLLFRLVMQMQASQVGTLLALGWSHPQIRNKFLCEGGLIAAVGSALGVLFGIFYAKIMIYGLSTWWVDAISVPFVNFHMNYWTLIIGWKTGTILALVTIFFSLRGFRQLSIRALLGKNWERQQKLISPTKSKRKFVLVLKNHVRSLHFFLLISGCFVAYFWMSFPPASFLFGTIYLAFLIWNVSRKWTNSENIQTLFQLARSNAMRNRTRSILAIALVASSTFLLLAMSAFRLDPNVSGGVAGFSGTGLTGGFQFVFETAYPVYYDIGTKSGRNEIGIQSKDNDILEENGIDIISCRMKDGDNASCLNLYQAGNPRILGLPDSFIEKNPFNFSQTKQSRSESGASVSRWNALKQPIRLDSDEVRRVPVILDANTAQYSLHLYAGIGETFEIKSEQEKPIRCEVVGLLGNSALQGDILMSEQNLLELFPNVSGFQFFLVSQKSNLRNEKPKSLSDQTPLGTLNSASEKILRDLMADFGIRGESMTDRLRKLFAIQNTYLSTFQSLGGIGLLLGILGLTVIQVRTILERRHELALLSALGFTKSRTILLLVYESSLLVLTAIFVAIMALCMALLPFLFGIIFGEIFDGRIGQPIQPISFYSIGQLFLWLCGGMIFIVFVTNFFVTLSILRIPIARELAEEK